MEEKSSTLLLEKHCLNFRQLQQNDDMVTISHQNFLNPRKCFTITNTVMLLLLRKYLFLTLYVFCGWACTCKWDKNRLLMSEPSPDEGVRVKYLFLNLSQSKPGLNPKMKVFLVWFLFNCSRNVTGQNDILKMLCGSSALI